MSVDKFGRSASASQHEIHMPRIRLPFTITEYGNINFGNVTLFNIKNPAGRSDATNKDYVDWNLQVLQQNIDAVKSVEATHHDKMKKVLDDFRKELNEAHTVFSSIRLSGQQTLTELDKLKANVHTFISSIKLSVQQTLTEMDNQKSNLHHLYDEIMDMRRTQQDLKAFKQETLALKGIEKKAVQKNIDDLTAKLNILSNDVSKEKEIRQKEVNKLIEQVKILNDDAFNQLAHGSPKYTIIPPNIKNKKPNKLIKREVSIKDAALEGKTADSQ